MTTYRLHVTGRDTWTDRTLDRIEQAARGSIVYQQDDGCGKMWWEIRPRVRLTKPERKVILEAVQAIAPNSRWVEV